MKDQNCKDENDNPCAITTKMNGVKTELSLAPKSPKSQPNPSPNRTKRRKCLEPKKLGMGMGMGMKSILQGKNDSHDNSISKQVDVDVKGSDKDKNHMNSKAPQQVEQENLKSCDSDNKKNEKRLTSTEVSGYSGHEARNYKTRRDLLDLDIKKSQLQNISSKPCESGTNDTQPDKHLESDKNMIISHRSDVKTIKLKSQQDLMESNVNQDELLNRKKRRLNSCEIESDKTGSSSDNEQMTKSENRSRSTSPETTEMDLRMKHIPPKKKFKLYFERDEENNRSSNASSNAGSPFRPWDQQKEEMEDPVATPPHINNPFLAANNPAMTLTDPRLAAENPALAAAANTALLAANPALAAAAAANPALAAMAANPALAASNPALAACNPALAASNPALAASNPALAAMAAAYLPLMNLMMPYIYQQQQQQQQQQQIGSTTVIPIPIPIPVPSLSDKQHGQFLPMSEPQTEPLSLLVDKNNSTEKSLLPKVSTNDLISKNCDSEKPINFSMTKQNGESITATDRQKLRNIEELTKPAGALSDSYKAIKYPGKLSDSHKAMKRTRPMSDNNYDPVNDQTDELLNLSKPRQKNYKNMTRARRVEANARERQRVHTITEAFESVKRAVPLLDDSAGEQKLSKLSIIKVATQYIMYLSRVCGYDYSEDQSAPSVEECLEKCHEIIQNDSKHKKRN